jgi:hypothetical protein
MANRFILNFADVPAERHAEADACGDRTAGGWLVDMALPCFRQLSPRVPLIALPRGVAFAPDPPLRPGGKATPRREETDAERDARELGAAIADPKGLGDAVAVLIHKTGLDRVNAAYRRHVKAVAGCKCNARRKRLNRVGELLAGWVKGSG